MQRLEVQIQSRRKLLIYILTIISAREFALAVSAHVEPIIKVQIRSSISQHGVHGVLRVVVMEKSLVHGCLHFLIAARRLRVNLRNRLKIELGRLVVVER